MQLPNIFDVPFFLPYLSYPVNLVLKVKTYTTTCMWEFQNNVIHYFSVIIYVCDWISTSQWERGFPCGTNLPPHFRYIMLIVILYLFLEGN